jgi:calpain-7
MLVVGDYTVVVSAFEPGHTGPFTLRVESSHHFELTPIPQEGAGTYHKELRGAWLVLFIRWIFSGLMNNYSRDSQTAAGGPDFKQYLRNPVYEVRLTSVTQLKQVFILLHPISLFTPNSTESAFNFYGRRLLSH